MLVSGATTYWSWVTCSPGKKINIRAFDQLRSFDTEPAHDLIGLDDTVFGRLRIAENDFDLQKITECLNSVEQGPQHSHKSAFPV